MRRFFEKQAPSQVALVLFFTGFFGFCIGAFGQTTWQVAVETSQVVAGIVEYPKYNPFYIFQTTLWTIVHQICAIFLLLGVSERMLSLLLSGFLGMLSFQALALCVFALSQNKILAIVSPVFIYFIRAVDFGVIYPVWLMGQPHTYGILGRSWSLLIIGLLGCGQYKLGGLLLGLAPAIHPSLGAFIWLVVLSSFVWDFHNLREVFRASIKYVVLGCCITLISAVFHFLVTYDAPSVAPEVASRYITTFIKFWDFHRQPVYFRSIGVYLVLSSLIISFLWLKFFKQDLPDHSLFLLRAFVSSAVLGLGFALISLLPPEIVPTSFLIMMPARYLNVNILGFMAILIGLLGHYTNNLGIQFIFSILVVLPVVSRIIPLALRLTADYITPTFINNLLRSVWSGQVHREVVWITMLVVSLAFIMLKSILTRRYILNFIREIILFSVGITFVIVGTMTYLQWKNKIDGPQEWMTNNLRDWTNDPLFAEVYARPGILLTCSDMYLIQLRTRRPVLLEGGALDNLAYAPGAGLEMDRILREVYGVDFFHPPEEARYKAAVPVQYTKRIWESRPLEQWYEISKRFEVNDVLTYADWKLQLPKVVGNGSFVLYHIPQ